MHVPCMPILCLKLHEAGWPGLELKISCAATPCRLKMIDISSKLILQKVMEELSLFINMSKDGQTVSSQEEVLVCVLLWVLFHK